jgi:autotransporter translocation and assembly factor TamB
MEVHVKNSVQTVSIAGLVTTMAFALFSIVQLHGTAAAQITGDFRNAAMAEVRDAQGQTLLRGTFVVAESDDAGEVERLAKLEGANTSVTATGEAEVEYEEDTPTVQEVELTVTGITAGAEVTLVIDGAVVTTAKADTRGRVNVEVAVKGQ